MSHSLIKKKIYIHQLIRHLHVVRAVLSRAPTHTCLLRNSDFNKYESNSIVRIGALTVQ